MACCDGCLSRLAVLGGEQTPDDMGPIDSAAPKWSSRMNGIGRVLVRRWT